MAASELVELTGELWQVMERTIDKMTAHDEQDPHAEAILPLVPRDRRPGAYPSIAVTTNDSP